jgi:hypothetical protein
MTMAERSLVSWIRIAARLVPTVRHVRELPAEQRTPVNLLPLVDPALAILEEEGVTLAEIRELLKDAGPLISLVGGLV